MGAQWILEAVENGSILIKDSTCPALHAQLQATEKAVPFMPLRGVIGSDIQKHRQDWCVIENPMQSSGIQNEPILLLPAVQLDILVFHASCSDRNGNIQIGRRRELATLAHASKKVFVTVEKILDVDFFDDELSAATCLPALYIDGVSVVKNGAWPCALPGEYPADNIEIKKYSLAAKTKKGFEYSKNYNLSIETINSTGFIELLSLNTPVILIINKKFYHIKKEYRKYYKKLIECNIIFFDIKKATARFKKKYISNQVRKHGIQRATEILSVSIRTIKNHLMNEIKDISSLVA